MRTIIQASLLFLLPLSPYLANAQEVVSPPTDPRACDLAAHDGESPEGLAQRCAERFMAVNGYTSAPPAPNDELWVSEFIEFGDSWEEVMRLRRATFAATAESAHCNEFRCTVIFKELRRICGYRAVVMTTDHRDMRLEHQQMYSIECPERDSNAR